MITVIRPENLDQISNPALAAYAQIYLEIYDDFLRQIDDIGLELDSTDTNQPTVERASQLEEKGAVLRNQGKSIYINRISPACLACQTGVGSATFFISLKCHRNCYYCFNPYQENYEFFLTHKRDLIQELEEIRRRPAASLYSTSRMPWHSLHTLESISPRLIRVFTPAAITPMLKPWSSCVTPGWTKYALASACTIWKKASGTPLTGSPWRNRTFPM